MGGEDSEEDGEDERDKPKPAADSSSSSGGADRSEGDVSDGGANSNGVSAVLSRVQALTDPAKLPLVCSPIPRTSPVLTSLDDASKHDRQLCRCHAQSESGDENEQPEAAKPSAAKSPGPASVAAQKASKVPAEKSAPPPTRPAATAVVRVDLDATSSDQAASGACSNLTLDLTQTQSRHSKVIVRSCAPRVTACVRRRQRQQQRTR